MTNIAIENDHAINGKTHYTYPFSMATSNYHRVYTWNFMGFSVMHSSATWFTKKSLIQK